MNHQKYYYPPRIASLVLGWLLKDQWETPLGDYEEYYNELATAKGESKARWWYWGQVLRLLPDQLYEKTYWGVLMLKNYLLLGFRTLRKNKLASSINIIGLSAAVGCAITVFLLIQEVTTDDFHEQGDRIFLVEHSVEEEGRQELWGTTPVPLGPMLASDFSQIERAVRFADEEALVQANENTFQETVSFADAGFFDMFTFPLLQGQETALEDPGALIVSSDIAAKYFKNQNPIGQSLEITFKNGSTESLTVSGVAKPFPPRASFKFDFLMGYEKRISAGLVGPEDWSAFTDGTFIQLTETSDLSLIADQLQRYVPVQNAASGTWQIHSFFLENIQNPDRIKAWNIHDRVISAFPLWEMVGFGLIGLLVLLISCFNYITIALASAASRLREIGIRKTAGAEKRQLIVQFLTENLLLCFVALLGGIVIAWTVLVPFWYSLTSMQLQLDFTSNPGLWIFLVGLLAFIGLVSGSYPAFYISSFQPIAILRGKLKIAEKKKLTRILTTVQFVLTIMTICISFFMVSLDNTLAGGDWGYNKEESLILPGLTNEQYARLHSEAIQLSSVREAAGTADHIGSSLKAVSIRVKGVEKEAAYFGVGPTYLAAMGIKTRAGRAFGEDFSADGASGVVVNQTLVQHQGWTEPIGQQVRIDDQVFSVIGVVEDFLLHPVAGKAHPAVFGLSDKTAYSVLALRVESEATHQVVTSLKTIWDEQFPGVDFKYFPQREVFQEFDFIINLTQRFSRYLGLFALFISCMGLFGMASQRATQRMKEIGIRKAMGASATQVILLVNRSFLVMLGISTFIATPLCYFGLSLVLHLAPAEIPLSIAPFVLSNLLVFCVAAASLFMQTNKLVKVKPASVLRHA